MRVSGTVPAPRLWSPGSPTLYTVEASLSGSVRDRVTDRFGFREFVARDGGFFLNGEPFYMIGALDQDFYPDTIYSTPGKAYLIDMMQKGRALGLNVLRCHIKVCDPDYLAAADEVGMLVWYEVPSWERWTPASVERGKAIFDAMTKRDWNRPSIVIQTLINEAWGIDMKQADQRAGLLKWFEESRPKLQPLGRLLVDNSPCCENFHLKTDIDDYHQYLSIPDNADRWDKWVADFATRPAWAFSSHGDAVRTKREPLVVSEFGNWGLPVLPAELPWWFARDFDGRAITRPAGLFDRFHGLGFDRVFGDYPTLARETQWRQFYSLKHEIESMRRHALDSGVRHHGVHRHQLGSQRADGHVAASQDLRRAPGGYPAGRRAAALDAACATSCRARRCRSSTSSCRATAPSRPGGAIKWTTTSGHDRELPVGTAPWPAAAVEAAGVAGTDDASRSTARRCEQVTLELKAADGTVLARNTHDLFVYPPPPPVPEGVVLHDPNALLGPLPWKAAALTPGATVVSSVFDAEVRAHVEGGRRRSCPGLEGALRRGRGPGPEHRRAPRGIGRQLGDQLHLAAHGERRCSADSA